MESLDDFLQSLEVRLRLSGERRTEVIEELAGHLEDRVDALVAQGYTRLSAERLALREVGAPRVMAFRLSRANGWSLAAFVLRQVWALGIVCLIGFSVILSLDEMEFPDALGPVHLLALVPFVLFAFALGGVVRELYWAVALTNLTALLTGASRDLAPLLLAGLAFVAAVAGHWVRWSRLSELAWASGTLTVLTACLLPWNSQAYTARDLLFGREALIGWMALIAVWLPWFFAFMLDTLGRRASHRWRGTPG